VGDDNPGVASLATEPSSHNEKEVGIGFGDNSGKNVKGDHSKHVDEGVSVSSPKDGQLIVANASATGIIPQPVEFYQTNKKENDDDVPSEKSSEHTPSPQAFGLTGDSGQSLPIVTPLNIQRPHDDGSYSSIDRSARIPDVAIPEYIREKSLFADIEKSIENYSTTDEDIKEEFGVDVGKMLRRMFLKRRRRLQIIRMMILLFVKQKVQNVSIFSIDEHNPVVIQKDEELRHTLESSVLLDIINPANPDIHVCMTKTDFLSLAPKTWLTGASIDACSYLLNRREEEKPGNPRRFWFNILPFRKKKEYIKSIIAEKEIDLEKAKDNPCYDTMKAERLEDKQKMTYREFVFFADKCRQSMSEWEKIVMFCKVFCKVIESSVVVLMVFTIGIEGLFLLLGEVIKTTSIVVFIALKLWNGMMVGMRRSIQLLHFQKRIPIFYTAYTKNLSRCHIAIDLVSYKENRRKQEVFKDCALWSKKRKDKEKHLANLRVKGLEKVILEDEKIKKERERHEQEVDDFLNNDLDDSRK
ncbi:50S ribosomal protein L15, partial [Bienertia sinuspersici]